ncbi:MAG: DUF4339 domain-containing protein [Verrucomicrobia bacterium]|jgi:uncharacterized membrane protein|nr:DUF4339 domain-containing protein [Verrucomicrobiota bacterium]
MLKIIGGDGKEYGPVTGDQVRQWIREGRANAQTRVQREGEAGWIRLGELAEFEEVLGRKLETVPPVGAFSVLPGDVLERDYALDIGACVSRAAELLKTQFGLLFGAAAIYLLIQGAMSGLGSIPFIGPVFSLGSLFVVGQLMAGLYLVILKAQRRQPTEVGEVFAGFKTAYVPLLLCYIVITLLTALVALPGAALIAVPVVIMVKKEAVDAALLAVAVLGLLVTLVPTIYVSVAWMFGLPLVIDKGLAFWPAMETSRKVVNKHWWSVFGLLIVIGLINLVGVLLCCVGVFLTFPLGMAALMCAYETLFSPREGQSA